MKVSLPNMALFNRTLMMDNRHWHGYLLRLVLMVVILFALLSFSLSSTFTAQASAVGLQFFTTIANTNLVFISIFAITLFSSAITEEKEIDSLNLLLMTGIGPFAMLLSKGASKMISAMMLIVAQFPFTLLAITLGGVGFMQILGVYLSLISYMILVANIALFFSVIAKKSANSAVYTMIALLLLNVFAPFWWWSEFLSPFMQTSRILATQSSGDLFNAQVYGSVIVGGSFFLLSFMSFNYFSRLTDSSSGLSAFTSRRWFQVKFFRVSRAWDRAIYWKEFYFTAGGKLTFFVIPLITVSIIAISSYLSNYMPTVEDIGSWLLTFGLIFLFLKGIYLSSSLFSREVWNKTHSSLVLLPISLRELAYKKILGGLIIMIPSVIMVLSSAVIFRENIFEFFLTEFSGIKEIAIFVAVICYAFIAIIFYFHLVTYLSLIIKHGAFAIAAVAVYAIQMLFMIPFMVLPLLGNLVGYNQEWIIVVVVVMFLLIYNLATLFLHILIGKKLIAIASQ
jgi:hypothetical protein